jgi:sugar phosphate isomerase/epimerase
MASRKSRSMLGEDESDNYVRGFKGLKAIGYQDFVSFECRYKGKGDHKEILSNAVKLLREQWEQA